MTGSRIRVSTIPTERLSPRGFFSAADYLIDQKSVVTLAILLTCGLREGNEIPAQSGHNGHGEDGNTYSLKYG